MVAEIRPKCPTEWAAMKAVAAKLGIGAAERTPNCRRANEILKVASAFFAAEPDRPAKRS
jgi:transposase